MPQIKTNQTVNLLLLQQVTSTYIWETKYKYSAKYLAGNN